MKREDASAVADLHQQCAQDYRDAAPQRDPGAVQDAQASAAEHAVEAQQADRGQS
ncbi:hypothetical protein [Streptomyces misionensis]|uniref:hypothetical protein n=1 Tax=Streptomyces misionensis TaxID=67331 RepID=UPI0036CF04A6